VKTRSWLPVLGLALLLPAGVQAGEGERSDVFTFGVLKAAAPEAARAQAQAWLGAAGKSDAAARQQFAAIWGQGERLVLDRIADTLALGDARAAQLLADARDPAKPAPKAVPELLKDKKAPAFFRANLALAYARALTSRRVFEEALDTLRLVKPEEVADPAAYYFYKAVAEHGLVRKEAAAQSILRLLEDCGDVPERYKAVAELMFADMKGWKKDERDLAHISRLMDNIERRLDLSRGGQVTQEIQKKVLFRLDELIKEMENQAKQCSQCNGGNCPSGGQPKPGLRAGGRPTGPMLDSMPGGMTGPGNATEEVVRGLAKKWGALPQKEREKALAELTRELPSRHKEAVQLYFDALSRTLPPAGR
jgi:hypothetical protein